MSKKIAYSWPSQTTYNLLTMTQTMYIFSAITLTSIFFTRITQASWKFETSWKWNWVKLLEYHATRKNSYITLPEENHMPIQWLWSFSWFVLSIKLSHLFTDLRDSIIYGCQKNSYLAAITSVSKGVQQFTWVIFILYYYEEVWNSFISTLCG